MGNKIVVPDSMNVIPGVDDYTTLFEVDKSNWVEMNNLDANSVWKNKVTDKMWSDDMKEKHLLKIKSYITRDPGNTGGDECKHNIDEARKNIMFSGKIDWYEKDDSLGRSAGNRVGVMIEFPTATDEDLKSLKIRISGKVYDQSVLDEHEGKKVLWYYPLVKSNEASYKVELIWGEETNNEVHYVFISPSTVLKEKEKEGK